MERGLKVKLEANATIERIVIDLVDVNNQIRDPWDRKHKITIQGHMSHDYRLNEEHKEPFQVQMWCPEPMMEAIHTLLYSMLISQEDFERRKSENE